MGNGCAKKPPFPGIESRSNAQSDAPEARHSSAVPVRALKYLRNHAQHREELYGWKKEKDGRPRPELEGIFQVGLNSCAHI
jgi:hypothetical protein